MGLNAVLLLAIFAGFILRALSLVGNNVCKTSSREECCYSYFRLKDFCVPCPSGTFGYNCTGMCEKSFGQGCESTCNCTQYEVCHPSDGCIPIKGFEHQTVTFHEASDESTPIEILNGAGIHFNHTECKSKTHGTSTYFSIWQIAILGALLLLFVLVIINIIVCSRLVMKVKRASYHISPRRRNPYHTPINVTARGVNRTTDLFVNDEELARRAGQEWTHGNQSTFTGLNALTRI